MTPQRHSTPHNAVNRNPNAAVAEERAVLARFPHNEYIHRLLAKAKAMDVRFARSDVHEQWLYHPYYRTLWVWEPDVVTQSLSYLVVIIAHELGHALDFDEKPAYREMTRHLQWWQVPEEIERSAFVRGFLILEELEIPITLDQYVSMIEEPMAGQVAAELGARTVASRNCKAWTKGIQPCRSAI